MTLRAFDFREIAGLDDTATAIRTWLSKSTSFFSDEWVQATGFGAKLGLGPVSTDSFESILDATPRTDWCSVAYLREDLPTLWYSSGAQFRKLVGELICIDPPEETEGEQSEPEEPVELGAIEADLVQWFLDTMAACLGQGWMGNEDMTVQTSHLEKDPRKLRLYRAKDLMTKVTLKIECKSVVADVHWLLPKQKISKLFEDTVDNRRKAPPKSPSKEMIAQMPVEVITLLGSAKISMKDLKDIKPGQLIVLDQRIDAPMTSTVDGAPSFECWPGRLGNMQAVQVSQTKNG
ncbi:FliM/FliN family flagellar motor switch protein [Stieleria sp. JC731]|uniref:FliM/FliN family flagellar motor switch protein n=1 Tax=Pirellulaceae TaxID=2691357 RepID=UPI001E38DB8F|nr:FliM/FliN family flagellar motor switch protein [Stieleria sp. JC731]MCC9602941.1 FliM/FliN family flagellar motor switch protein [Stieleria sp. JC731]